MMATTIDEQLKKDFDSKFNTLDHDKPSKDLKDAIREARILEGELEGNTSQERGFDPDKDCSNNPIRYIAPTGHTQWDIDHLSAADYAKLEEIWAKYAVAKTPEERTKLHLEAEAIREPYRQGTGNSNLKQNGQDRGFSGYGGIEDPTTYVSYEYGSGWIESKAASISGIENFTQAQLEKNANNCTLASIARIMKYYSDMGYTSIPSDINEIYKKIREIGVEHGYNPIKTGLWRDLFIYTPWEIDNMVKDAWKAFGYPKGSGNNDYFGKLETIKSYVDNSNPLLLNIVSGDYPGHTVTVIGYKTYSQKGERDINLIQIYDGWEDRIRYIDWEKFGGGPTTSNLTKILPPQNK
jgi:hypothetical protein